MLVKLDKEDFVISVEREMTEAKTAICKGPYHNRSGKGTPLPIEQFPQNRYHPEKRTKLCERCIAPRRNSVPEADGVQLTKVVNAPEFGARREDLENGGMQHKWMVEFLNPTECVVYAKNYQDAALQVQGEIVRIERLD